MIFLYPDLVAEDLEVLDMIEGLRRSLRHDVQNSPSKWTGFLRRNTFARALRGSNSIEGINATFAEAVAIVDHGKPETLEEEIEKALSCYRNAMGYILALHNDPHAEITAQLIRSLHFMLQSYDMTMLPGRWRTRPIGVINSQTGQTVYEAPDHNAVPGLVDELISQIKEPGHNSTVTAAMAHLNLTMIHPFRDGNGRMSRALQTLVLTRDQIVSPEFCSIEEWLGRNTDAYYDILSKVGQGAWHPENDALPWVRFCLVAHYQQAQTIVKRNLVFTRMWEEIARLRKEARLPERAESAMMDAALNIPVRNAHYRADQDITDAVANRDLKMMVDHGLLSPVGEKRGRYYIATEILRAVWEKCADRTRAPNPYDLIRRLT